MNRAGTRIGLNFVNHGAAPADEVHFTIVYGGVSRRLWDRGTFSHGVQIAHVFTANYDRYMGRLLPENCYADYAHFSDGTTWTAPH